MNTDKAHLAASESESPAAVLEQVLAVFDRLVKGEPLHQVVGETRITRKILLAKVVAERERELLCCATTAVRDLDAGYQSKDIAAPFGGQGLDSLMIECVTHLRSQGENDDGAWDIEATRNIPVRTARGTASVEGGDEKPDPGPGLRFSQIKDAVIAAGFTVVEMELPEVDMNQFLGIPNSPKP